YARRTTRRAPCARDAVPAVPPADPAVAGYQGHRAGRCARRCAYRACLAVGSAAAPGKPASGAGRHAGGPAPGAVAGRPAGHPANVPGWYRSARGREGSNRSRVGHYRTEIEALEPSVGLAEAGSLQPFEVRLLSVQQHDILDGAAFLGDFQVAVAIGALEGVMHLLQVMLHVRLGETEFLREDKHTTGQQRIAYAAQHCQSMLRGDE